MDCSSLTLSRYLHTLPYYFVNPCNMDFNEARENGVFCGRHTNVVDSVLFHTILSHLSLTTTQQHPTKYYCLFKDNQFFRAAHNWNGVQPGSNVSLNTDNGTIYCQISSFVLVVTKNKCYKLLT